LLNLNLYSQNISHKKWKSNDFDLIFLDLDFTSNLTINESISSDIYVKYNQEGEFKKNVILKMNMDNRELNIQEVLSPTLKRHNDKLSVHKTISNTIDVSIPIDFKIIVKTKSCNIKIMSSFSDINIEIEEGKVNLNQKKIQGKIKSISANIFCVNPYSKVFVNSREDKISSLHNLSVMPNLIIETIRGDVIEECFIN
tara:strand:+ start:1059 stop:1652 length:594 start_codon:yes stop_codon:yes gene_type:complete